MKEFPVWLVALLGVVFFLAGYGLPSLVEDLIELRRLRTK